MPPIVEEVLRSPGQPLDAATRAFMESRFGHDFSQVRVHTDQKAAESARVVNALAYTVGHDVVFGAGKYAIAGDEGRRLLAHELAHVVQAAPRIARRGVSDAPPARLRPHIPSAPVIPAPPVPKQTPPPPRCPDAATAAAQIASEGIPAQTTAAIRQEISLAAARAAGTRTVRLTDSLLAQADMAAHAEFGPLLPSRSFSRGGSITRQTPDQFANYRVPDPPTARRRIGEVALATAADALRDVCITRPDDPVLDSTVNVPVLAALGIDTIRDFEKARIGGETAFSDQPGALPHVNIPTESRNLGHIVVHEAMHFYVHETYRATAEAGPLRQELMEGGAEFTARQVIHQHLANDPNFQINYSTYASEFQYVAQNLLRGGLSSFSQAYFRGRVDLLGLAPTGIHPKLVISQASDPLEQEADRLADETIRQPGREPEPTIP